MSNYRGIPFNGGLDSPSGSGAQHIVETLKAIIDYLQGCVTPGHLATAAGAPVFDWQNRQMFTVSAVKTVDWENAGLYTYLDGSVVMDWGNRHTFDSLGRQSIDWGNRVLKDAASGNALLTWADGLVVTNIPTSDPGVTGQLWNNAGVLSVSM